MTSKAERKRRKRAHKEDDEFALAETQRREPNGRKKRDTSENAATPAFIKRVALAGKSLSKQTIKEAADPWCGCNAGRALDRAARSRTELMELWGTVQAVRSAHRSYCAVMGIPQPNAKVAALGAVPEPLQADSTTPPIDTRSDEEKQRAAVSAWMRVQGALMHLPSHWHSHTWNVIITDDPVKDAEKFRECVIKVGEVLAR